MKVKRIPLALFCLVLLHSVILSPGTGGTSVNIALHKPANQSSVFNPKHLYAAAGKAVDGIAKNHFKDKSCTHTLFDSPDAWWEVDLLDYYSIGNIRILNRDKNEERLHDLQIDVYENKDEPRKKKHCVTHPGPAGPDWLSLSCGSPVIGRFVRITKPKTEISDVLTMCEVEIYEALEKLRFMNLERNSMTAVWCQDHEVRARSTTHCGIICCATSGCKGLSVSSKADGYSWCTIFVRCLDNKEGFNQTNGIYFIPW